MPFFGSAAGLAPPVVLVLVEPPEQAAIATLNPTPTKNKEIARLPDLKRDRAANRCIHPSAKLQNSCRLFILGTPYRYKA
jgi:hypothetical protein